mmetsp:Transcript_151821/g.487187  ORF Transcript_151821/g.487187 Transcript_151821/m.487187 type:complete len:388 (-) Transcript_151821:421-1584(-)
MSLATSNSHRPRALRDAHRCPRLLLLLKTATALAFSILTTTQEDIRLLVLGVPIGTVSVSGDGEVFTACYKGRWRIRRPVVHCRGERLHGLELHVRVIVPVGHGSFQVLLRVLTSEQVLANHAKGVALVDALRPRVSETELNAAVVTEREHVPGSIPDHCVASANSNFNDPACFRRQGDLHGRLYLNPRAVLQGTHWSLLSRRTSSTLAPLVSPYTIDFATMRDETAVLQTDTHRLDASCSSQGAKLAWLWEPRDQPALQGDRGQRGGGRVRLQGLEDILEDDGMATACQRKYFVRRALNIHEAAAPALTPNIDGNWPHALLLARALTPNVEQTPSIQRGAKVGPENDLGPASLVLLEPLDALRPQDIARCSPRHALRATPNVHLVP